MSAADDKDGVTVPQTTIVERDLLTVKWWSGNRMKVARFHLATDDRVVTLDSLFVREHPRSSKRNSYYIRDATLDDIPSAVQRLMQTYGYEPAQELEGTDD